MNENTENEKLMNTVCNYLNAIMALSKQSNDENTDAIVMLCLEAENVLYRNLGESKGE